MQQYLTMQQNLPLDVLQNGMAALLFGTCFEELSPPHHIYSMVKLVLRLHCKRVFVLLVFAWIHAHAIIWMQIMKTWKKCCFHTMTLQLSITSLLTFGQYHEMLISSANYD